MPLTKRAEAVLGQQLARWEQARREARHRPTVAIANLQGAGGERVGRLVADALGYGCFGREIVDEIARRRGVAPELMRGLDERVRSAIERFVADAFSVGRFTESDYLREVVRAVTTLDRRGMAVIVGRGAAFILDQGSAFRVLVVAPLAVRVRRFAAERGLAPEEAERLLREEDERRTRFIQHHFGARLDDPLRYDLVVNTGTLGIDAAATVVREAFVEHAKRAARQP